MEKRVSPQSNVMMLELVITVGFFAIISIFLLKIFVAADAAEENAVMISKATIIAESAFEHISAGEELGFTAVTENDEKLRVAYYDRDWNKVDVATAYTLKLYEQTEPTAKGDLISYRLVFLREPRGNDKDSTEIISMETKKYRKEVSTVEE